MQELKTDERFANLFRGFTGRYGRYDIQTTEASGKRTGKATTVDKPIAGKDYASHVKGVYGIGVIPLCDDDATVHFAALDIDQYGDKAPDHWHWALLLRDEPLVITKSKSGGMHIWFFSAEGVPAQLAIEYMQSLAGRLGFAGCEILPKQSRRSSAADVGNWINLPYFGDERTAVVVKASKVGFDKVDPADLDLFLLVGEAAAKLGTADTIKALTVQEPNQRDGSADVSEEWYDGPPCLQRLVHGDPKKRTLIQKRFDEGEINREQYDKQMAATRPQLNVGRDNTFFNVAQYQKRKHFGPGEVKERDRAELTTMLATTSATWAAVTGQDPLSKAELDKCAKQGSKDAWNYQCNVEPLKSFCDRRACIKRKFGIASKSQESAIEVTGFTVINSDPPQYAFNVGDKRVCMGGADLLNQRKFREFLFTGAGVMWQVMTDGKFYELVDGWRKNADEVDGPPDTGLGANIAQALVDFCYGNRTVRGIGNDHRLITGGALWSEEDVWFVIGKFEKFLLSRNVRIPTVELGRRLIEDIGCTHLTSVNIKHAQGGGRTTARPYVVKVAILEKLRGAESGVP